MHPRQTRSLSSPPNRRLRRKIRPGCLRPGFYNDIQDQQVEERVRLLVPDGAQGEPQTDQLVGAVFRIPCNLSASKS